MSTPKLLINRKTKAVFPFHPLLLKNNRNLEPYDEQATEDDIPAGDTGADSGASEGIILSKAKRHELIKFAMDNFSIQIEDDQTVPEIREQIQRLIESGK